MPPGAYHTLKEQIRRDLVNIWAVPVNTELIGVSVRLLDSHPLKALDSLYLAGGLSLQQSSKHSVLFVSADHQLLRAAQAEGLGVLNPETGS